MLKAIFNFQMHVDVIIYVRKPQNIKFARLEMSTKLMKINFANTKMHILGNSNMFNYIYTQHRESLGWYIGITLSVRTSIFYVRLTVCAIVYGPYLSLH